MRMDLLIDACQETLMSVQNGKVTINTSGSNVFIGATAPGNYPEVGFKYERFTFAPLPSEGGMVVFQSDHPVIKNRITIYQFWWDNGKLVYKYKVEHTKHELSQSEQH